VARALNLKLSGLPVSSLLKTKPLTPKDQGHLDFGRPDFAAENYLESPQNARARAKLETWRTWPGGVMCLCGETGSGKSHLGTMWANSANAPIFDGQAFDLTASFRLTEEAPTIALIDNAHACDETALFGLLTSLERKGGAVLLVARTPPSTWPFSLPDLQSRLKAIAVEVLTPPEPELLAQLIIRHSAALGFKIDVAASTYLANRIPRTFEATRDIVSCMQEVTSVSLKSPMALAQRALQALYQTEQYNDESATPDLFDH
jgi:chromosomal replication initiation ATPase DnaA